ncbi:AraC family transcriptional regulator [Gracilibacillus sp. S3-1-1]|uniref:AraC family transcriptional regulator n=1 Tax=Gracilibacillus pellucidus TaxID=3095368 RepID=A0ACC6M9L3_9BACI|nr:AraC family transcriptional regulator [Gracilibacillus sp. S3-1-1]MDX8047639.1 AraC family transcriptional regulator [Gracilibacillus sp. S3-1-1]
MDKISVNYRLTGKYDNLKAHSHLEYEIYLFHQGTCHYLIDNQIYDLQPGDILLMDGLALHKPNLPADSVYVRSHIHFLPHTVMPALDGLGAQMLLEVFHQLHHCLIRPETSKQSREVELLIKQMSEISEDITIPSKEKEWQLKTSLIQLLIVVNQLGQNASQKAVSEQYEKAQHAENIASYIQQHYHEKLSIEQIASALTISKSYVSHVFKEMTGYTVMEYVMATRLKQVKFLLEIEENKSLQQIADECGFESVSHFSRFFKKHVGITAKKYRQKRLEIDKGSE